MTEKKVKLSYTWVEVNDFFNKIGFHGRQWRYVTALRGPDNDYGNMKALTTCVIRGWPCEQAMSLYDTNLVAVGGSDDKHSTVLGRELQKSLIECSHGREHFIDHYASGLSELSFYLSKVHGKDAEDACKHLNAMRVSIRNWSNKGACVKYIKELKKFLRCVKHNNR